MTRLRATVRCAAIAATCIVCGLAHAQPRTLPHENMNLRYSGFEHWVVYLNSTNLSFRRRPVADFSTHEPADKLRDELNRALPLSSPHFYEVGEHSTKFSAPDPEPLAPPRAAPVTPSRTVPPLPASVAGTTWVGSETANDTNLKFVFKSNGEVLAYDDTRNVWSGVWWKTSEITVRIQLTSPRVINYYGTINGNRMSGSAKPSGSNGGWRWSVTLRPS